MSMSSDDDDKDGSTLRVVHSANDRGRVGGIEQQIGQTSTPPSRVHTLAKRDNPSHISKKCPPATKICSQFIRGTGILSFQDRGNKMYWHSSKNFTDVKSSLYEFQFGSRDLENL
ncbi:hypothetical protein V6N11_027917 [Hibiscus sabdariffa]|uniref:Uncharacterized protein n=1 Tax=Hibiscus sabdariffa TaxID=183260 RepID=A0ABR2NZ80_9ROSI